MAPAAKTPRNQNPKNIYSFDVQAFGIDANKAIEQCPTVPPPMFPPLFGKPPKLRKKLLAKKAEMYMRFKTGFKLRNWYIPSDYGILDVDVPPRLKKYKPLAESFFPRELQQIAVKAPAFKPEVKVENKRKCVEKESASSKKRKKNPTDEKSKDVSFDFTELEKKEIENQEFDMDDCDEEEEENTPPAKDEDDDDDEPAIVEAVQQAPSTMEDKKPEDNVAGDTTEPYSVSDNDNDPDDNQYYEEQEYDEDELIESTDYLNSYFDNGDDFEEDYDRIETEVY